MRVGMLAGLSPFLIDAIPERHGEFWKGRVRWGQARRGFFHYNDNSGNCFDRSHGSLLPICLDWLPYLPWLTFIDFYFTVDCGMCWKLPWSESRITSSYLPWPTSIFVLIDFHWFLFYRRLRDVLEIALIGVTDPSFLFALTDFHICLDWLPLVFILP